MPDGSNKGSLLQGYNAQIAVDSATQVIVAAEVTQETNDKQQLIRMIEYLVANLKQNPEKVSADAGYFSAAHLNDEAVEGIDLHIATGRDKHRDPVGSTTTEVSPGTTAREAMRHKLKAEVGHAV
jgi:DNA integrity scanning protein DisA with diadenylate cyclase activity